MYHNTMIKKIPGDILEPSRRESQGYIEDLSSKKVFELQEILERQNKLLKNKRFISKLPDKGAKITSFRDKVEQEIRTKNELEKVANLVSRLNIASEGKAAMTEIEWVGKYVEKPKMEDKVVQLDSDDEEEDPLKILAQPTGSGVHKKKIVYLPPEESLIRPEDLEDIEDFKGFSGEVHIEYIMGKVEGPKIGVESGRKSFKPYKTTKTDVHDPDKEIKRKRDKHWEVTAATPPPSIHGTTRLLNLQDSLKLQKEQAQKLEEIQIKEAFTRLSEQLHGPKIGNDIPCFGGGYRAQESSSSNSDVEGEEDEVHDDEDTDKGGTVVYTLKTGES
ncbi:uncharacterized protein LOC105683134 [Athalia rosae]|uniref:uncharacterized protein LOC105683134 n=1 Tax=Athalia rosae TaxID=37344 RepID=UPI002033D122|nr:uncharacterized protein LOC105683134 [Athalia rosae]